MSYSNKLTGIALATAAAAMFAGTPATAAESNGNTVKCMGVNACKGKSSSAARSADSQVRVRPDASPRLAGAWTGEYLARSTSTTL